MTSLLLDLSTVKRLSEQYIRSHGGEICDWLPSIGLEEIKLRDVEEVSARALVLNVMVNVGFGAPVEIACNWLTENHLLDALTPDERMIIENSTNPVEQIRNHLKWLVEGLWAAAWIGGLFEELLPDQSVSNSLASRFPSLRHNESAQHFYKTFSLRSADDIYQKLDLFYRSHWHVRNCELNGKDPAPFHSGVVQLRRQMLEWVLHKGTEWDDVDLST